MKTERLYYKDNHLKEFTAKVLSCAETKAGKLEVVLDRTTFFPEGGGQPADVGTLGGARVIDTKECGDEVIHIVEGGVCTVGETITGRIDWRHRFDIMQQHSGEHILSGIIHSQLGYDNVGFHIGTDYVTVDLNGPIDAEQLDKIEYMANEAIWANLPVITETPSPEKLAEMEYRSKKELSGEVRIVTIPGCDVCACCGVHVSATGEIGEIKIVDAKKYKGGVRLTIRCGARALVDHGAKQNSISEISKLLSTKPEETAQAVEKLLISYENTKYQLGLQEEKLVKFAAASIEKKSSKVCVITNGISPEGVWKYAAALSERFDYAAVFSEEKSSYSYAAASGDAELDAFNKALCGALNGRGGGRGGIVRGSVGAKAGEIRAFIEKLEDSWFVVFGNNK